MPVLRAQSTQANCCYWGRGERRTVSTQGGWEVVLLVNAIN